MKYYHLIILTFLLCLSNAASSQEDWHDAVRKINVKDSRILPPFCGINVAPRYKNIDWDKRFGHNAHLNHYCAHKAAIPVCYQYPEKEKNACLASMLEGTTYIFDHTSDPNYGLLPFFYTEHGEILKEIGRYGEAIQSFNTAIQKNNKYVRAYVMLADTYILTKQYDEAEKIVNEGLKIKKSKALYKKLEKIKASKK